MHPSISVILPALLEDEISGEAQSGVGGLLGGWALYLVSGGKFNPVIGIAGVSCVPTCAKVAQKAVAEVNPNAIVMPQALGASISGIITSAIFAGVLINLAT